MERGVKAGKIRSIGLSNFYEDDIDRMMKIATIKPAVLQNETHPYHQSRSVKAHIAKLGTILEAWFPLGGRGTGIKTLSEHETITKPRPTTSRPIRSCSAGTCNVAPSLSLAPLMLPISPRTTTSSTSN